MRQERGCNVEYCVIELYEQSRYGVGGIVDSRVRVWVFRGGGELHSCADRRMTGLDVWQQLAQSLGCKFFEKGLLDGCLYGSGRGRIGGEICL